MFRKDLSIKEIFAQASQDYKKKNFKSAESLYKQILKKNPNHFDSIVLLGALLAQSGKLEKAKKFFQKAVQIKPNSSNANYNLGLTFKKLGEYKKAVNNYEKAIKINPDYFIAYSNLGSVFYQLGEFKKARECYEKAIQINPNFANAHFGLGSLYEELNDFEKAKNYYKSAIQINPNFAIAHFGLGNIHEEFGQFQKAIDCYKKAIQLQNDFVDAYNNLALVFKNLGQYQQAISCYEDAIKYNSENLISIYLLSELKKEVLDSNLKEKIINIINKNDCTVKNHAYGNFLLSKYELKIKNYEKEFNYLLKAHSCILDLRKDLFNKEVNYWLNVLPKEKALVNFTKSINNFKESSGIKPIFIVGVPRCGSTLIEKVIASSSKYIPIGEETNIFRDFIRKLINQDSFSNLDIKNFQKQITKKFELRGLIQEKNDYFFTDKSLDNFFYIGLINKIFPNAKIINCRRNPLSTAMSIFKNIYKDIPWGHNLEHIFKYINVYKQMIDNYKKIFPNFIYDVRYEEFVDNPEEQSKKLLKFCDLPWNKKCLEFYKRKDIISKTASNLQIKNAIYKGSGDKYLQYKQFLYKYRKNIPILDKILIDIDLNDE